MAFKPYKPPLAQKSDESLFYGVWLRWSALNAAERLLCALIVLLPVWWAIGLIPYLLEGVTIGIFLQEWRCHGKIRLRRPGLLVAALFANATYAYIGTFLLFFDAHPLAALPPEAALKPLDLIESTIGSFSLPCLAWYIQSKNIRVRLEAVAWACSISIIQMLAVWLVVHFVLAEPAYNPPRTLLATLMGKEKLYVRGSGDLKYLLLYWPTDHAIAGFPRFYSFFHSPEAFGLFVGAVGTLALDIKNRLWSLLLLAASIFMIGLSGTRTIWIAFFVVLVVRSLLTTQKASGPALASVLVAITCFLTLSVSPVTDWALNTYTDTATYISDFRGNSTDTRASIYQATIEAIVEDDNPLTFLFGRETGGDSVTAGTGNEVGSHSYYLGSLLYKGGIIGTGLFIAYWGALIAWLYQTQRGRPASSFLLLLLLSIALATSLMGQVGPILIVLSMVLRSPAIKSFRRNTAWHVS